MELGAGLAASTRPVGTRANRNWIVVTSFNVNQILLLKHTVQGPVQSNPPPCELNTIQAIRAREIQRAGIAWTGQLV